VGMGVVHRLVVGDLIPSRICWFWKAIRTESFVKVAVQPWSRSCGMDISELWSCGKTYAVRAASGRVGWLSSIVVWVDDMVEPSAKVIVIGEVGCSFDDTMVDDGWR
jgi:hypothetical protein